MTPTATVKPGKAAAKRVNPHPQRKEIARYLLARGLDPDNMAPSVEVLDVAATTGRRPRCR